MSKRKTHKRKPRATAIAQGLQKPERAQVPTTRSMPSTEAEVQPYRPEPEPAPWLRFGVVLELGGKGLWATLLALIKGWMP